MSPTPGNAVRFRRLLLKWGQDGLRVFPWRNERDAFRLLLAEMMLRRTRANQVVPVYKQVTRRYRGPADIATGAPGELQRMLAPLGLRWRAEDIVAMARELIADHGGHVPASESELKRLTGVGDYVAAAVACFSGGVRTPIIDTNVARVLGRIFGLRLDGEARRRKEIRDTAALCLDQTDPRKYHYALLDFAAKVCIAGKPKCADCPFSSIGMCDYVGSRAKK